MSVCDIRGALRRQKNTNVTEAMSEYRTSLIFLPTSGLPNWKPLKFVVSILNIPAIGILCSNYDGLEEKKHFELSPGLPQPKGVNWSGVAPRTVCSNS
jgi:hypothetical protein